MYTNFSIETVETPLDPPLMVIKIGRRIRIFSHPNWSINTYTSNNEVSGFRKQDLKLDERSIPTLIKVLPPHGDYHFK